jgi:chromosome segregation ATPase
MAARHFYLCIALLSVVPVIGLQAQQARDPGGDARLQAMVTQLTSEKAALQSQNTRLGGELDEFKQRLTALETEHRQTLSQLNGTQASLNRTQTTNTQTAARLEQTEARLEELIARFRETIDTLAATELERNDYQDRLLARDREYELCVNNNLGLYRTGLELLDAYEDKGFFSRLGQKEPFFRVKRNQIESLVESYRFELEDNALHDATPGSGS